MRLTPEREKEIRKRTEWACEECAQHIHIYELLEEIEALRCEVDIIRHFRYEQPIEMRES